MLFARSLSAERTGVEQAIRIRRFIFGNRRSSINEKGFNFLFDLFCLTYLDF